ncbi:diacylglycerol kinase family protein [Gordonia jinhuaensis]|uniref:DAGKc domain-containing protein n=1 Tax=Gordonia jinhuaensis TaxID=1517702 RepID=A0A916T7J1_9ACTN|nr:diacylglycerol kinase family protein [Gordonia jinhuaensis]GGB34640.1 hypothetical protein GCM10011489_23410 [Gordonia jinhuaensis]
MFIVNPFATSTTPEGRDAMVNMLGGHVEVTVEHTTHRGHAGELGASARDGGFDAVIVNGGDGTVNEVVNGLIGRPACWAPTTRRPPALGVIPGGSANVFARALGIDPDPLRATAQLIDLLEASSTRRIGLGHADDRWFLFNAGMGVDARVVRAMEEYRRAGHRASDGLYLRATVRGFLAEAKREPALTVTADDLEPLEDVYFAFVSNTSPWTYLGSRPIEVNPGTTFDGGLGVFASTSMNVMGNLPLITRLLMNRSPHARHVLRADDVSDIRVVADRPVDVQMDGDYLGVRSALHFGCRSDVLDVVAPRS